MSTLSDFSIPDGPPDSPGSSVSTRLQDEYDELLKFAVVVPKYDPTSLPQTISDGRDSFSQRAPNGHSGTPTRETLITVGRERDDRVRSNGSPITVRVCQKDDVLPDFGGHSPIRKETEAKTAPRQERYFTSRVTKEMRTEPGPGMGEVEKEKDVSLEEGEYERVYTATVDPDIGKMENLMDQWCLDLKRNVLAEFSQSKIRIVETGRQQLFKEQERHASEKTQLLREMDGLKELLHTYEKSIERKDQVISNLTHAMQKQKDKHAMLKKFCDWKIKHNDMKREGFASNLAMRHYQRSLSQKIWDAWHSVIESKWRNRVEKACQAKAQEVCMQLTNDYEDKIASLNEALESSRVEVTKLHAERDRYEEMMKKAFMRGVCALNLEAMTMFQAGEDGGEPQPALNGRVGAQDEMAENMNGSLPEKDFSGPKTLPSEFDAHPAMAQRDHAAPRVVTSQGSRSSSATVTQSKPQVSKSSSTKSKVLTAKVSAKVDCGRSGISGGGTLAPPMSSVIVERHQPVTKQTVSHAVAGKYPRPSSGTSQSSTDSRGGIVHRRIAGQGTLTVSPNIQTVKVVD